MRSDLDVVIYADKPLSRRDAQQLLASADDLEVKVDIRIETPTWFFSNGVRNFPNQNDSAPPVAGPILGEDPRTGKVATLPHRFDELRAYFLVLVLELKRVAGLRRMFSGTGRHRAAVPSLAIPNVRPRAQPARRSFCSVGCLFYCSILALSVMTWLRFSIRSASSAKLSSQGLPLVARSQYISPFATQTAPPNSS
jgi:hypothetical protein